jgi:hypothetical protein
MTPIAAIVFCHVHFFLGRFRDHVHTCTNVDNIDFVIRELLQLLSILGKNLSFKKLLKCIESRSISVNVLLALVLT